MVSRFLGDPSTGNGNDASAIGDSRGAIPNPARETPRSTGVATPNLSAEKSGIRSSRSEVPRARRSRSSNCTWTRILPGLTGNRHASRCGALGSDPGTTRLDSPRRSPPGPLRVTRTCLGSESWLPAFAGEGMRTWTSRTA